uniref:AtpZ/AtpI family protein n=1 Tax=Stutzerimonas balearica TaxID=74829 RepID=UPI0028B141E5
ILAREDPEPSLARRLGQVGLLGWMIVTPLLLGLLVGRWLDRLLGSGVLFSAALVVAGAGLGLWSAWRWMHRQ